MTKMNKILMVDDHPLVLWVLQRAVQRAEPQAQIQALGSGQALRQQLRQGVRFDVALLDLELADDDGFALLALLRESNPTGLLVAMSGTERPGDVTRALDFGVMGFFSKRLLDVQAWLDALAFVRMGGIFVPPTAAEVRSDGSINDAKYQTLTKLGELGLTPRQADVLSLIVDGKSNKEIALITAVSLDTVKDHATAVMRALGVSSRSQVVRAVAELQKRQRERPSRSSD